MATTTAEKLEKVRDLKRKIAAAEKEARRLAGGDSARERGQHQRDVMAERSREASKSVSSIGEIPGVKDPPRKESCRLDLGRFLATYFPYSTGLSPFSADHGRVIARMQSALLDGGRFVNACYRGFAKTTIAENAAIWATLYGHRKFVPVFGADAGAAEISLDSIKMELAENDLLYEDFPEAVHAVRALEGRPQRAGAQSYHGKQTYIEWNAEMVRLPTIPGAPSSGAIIATRGIDSGFRGLTIKLRDGTQQRPDAILLDDIQTDDSARTPGQVAKTLRKLRKAIARLGGHRRGLAIVLNGTVIECDDALDRLLQDHAWQGERIPMIRQWAELHKTLWLENYAGLRTTYDPDDIGDQRRAHAEATAFYRDRREEMDRGGQVSWESCYDHDTELSALQHAYNILIDDGEEAFASECQSKPLRMEDLGSNILTAPEIEKKVNALPVGIVPASAAHLTAFIDVHDKLLVWCVCGWAGDFTGGVLAYGTYPRQRRPHCDPHNADPTLLAVAPPGAGEEGAIRAGLAVLTEQLAGREWRGESGAVHRIGLMMIDRGYKPDIVFDFCRASPHAAILIPSKGFAIGAKNRPYEEYTPKPGEQWSKDHWYRTRVALRAQFEIRFDTNFWKSLLFARMTLTLGDRSALTLYGKDGEGNPADHRIFAEQLTSEKPDLRWSAATRRSVNEWELRPGRGDNHLLDVLVGCLVGASIKGCVLPGAATAEKAPERTSWRAARQAAKERKAGR